MVLDSVMIHKNYPQYMTNPWILIKLSQSFPFMKNPANHKKTKNSELFLKYQVSYNEQLLHNRIIHKTYRWEHEQMRKTANNFLRTVVLAYLCKFSGLAANVLCKLSQIKLTLILYAGILAFFAWFYKNLPSFP